MTFSKVFVGEVYLKFTYTITTRDLFRINVTKRKQN